MKQLVKQTIQSLFPKRLWLDVRQWPIIRQHKRVARLCQRDLKRYKQGEIPTIQLSPLRPELVGKPIIWQYWGQGVKQDQLPEVVGVCFGSVDRYKDGYDVIRLSDETIAEYIELPKFVYDKLKSNPAFTRTFFSDLIRLALLSCYGGVWLDATILLSAPLPERYRAMPFFAFQRSEQEADQDYWRASYAFYWGWDKRFRVRLLNSILFAKPRHTLVVDLLSLLLNYWKEHDDIVDYFFFQIYFQEMVDESWGQYNCPIVSDCLPHILQTKINGGAYLKVTYQQAAQQCTLHKMTYFTEDRQIEFRKALDNIGLGDL